MKREPLKCGLAGRYKLVATRPDGSERLLADWFENLITDGGLDRIAVGNPSQYCHVGTGSTTPANTDTTLAAFLASTTTKISANQGVQSTPPYYGWNVIQYRFAPGVADGNISEVGIGWGASTNLFSRALVLDEEGDPTTITVLEDETLDVYYEFRLYPPTVDGGGSFELSEVEYDYVMRASEVTGVAWSGQFAISSGFGGGASPPQAIPTNGTIAAITAAPTGSSGASVNGSFAAYSNGSHELTANFSFGLGEGNTPTNEITAFRFQHSYGFGHYQASIDPAIPKTNAKVLSFPVTFSWARHA